MGITMQPLADKLRPTTLDEVFGQKHLIGPGKILRNMYTQKRVSSMIFYGPPGTGKTTIASILANNCGLPFYKVNATSASTADVRDIIKEAKGSSILLYVDEIQYFTKKQQQALLEYIENGLVTMIAATTENPSFTVFSGLLSRCIAIEFKHLDFDDLKEAVIATIEKVEDVNFKKYTFDANAIEFLVDMSDGDVRKAINNIELLSYMDFDSPILTQQMLADVMGRKVFKHDKDGTEHYNLISALQKSIRGSDPDASIHYLARLIVGGDITVACRRLLVIAAEDVGLAEPNAIAVVSACVDAAKGLGMPEARIPLAEAVIYLAMCPKSNSAYLAIDDALNDLKYSIGDIPSYMKDSHSFGGAGKIAYKYPHDFPHHYVKQDYLPKELLGKHYYVPQDTDSEQKFVDYWAKIK